MFQDRSPHQEYFLEVNGNRLHYLDWAGQGETLLFVPGSGNSAHIFDDIAPRFSPMYHVLALTRRGHGQSEKPAGDYSTASLVEDIRQFLDLLDIHRVILVGFSMAGVEMTYFAGHYPDRVAKLVFLDAIFPK